MSNGKRRKYYHKKCAEKLNIVVFLSKDIRNDKLRVLIVDDERDIIQVYRMFLERYGFEVEAFEDPQSALMNYKPNSYDLLLLDIRLPGMNGFELYKAILEKEEKTNLKFVLLPHTLI